jgi:hypothetical protein
MTVRFEFELSDVDAQNLLGILHLEYIAQSKVKVSAGSTRVE